jgi:ectoine hydroxylase-related dioxygenase (phytanoyl-CoA dioxygenase family)
MQQNGIALSPQSSHRQSAYHRDLPYQHFVSSRPLAINALLALDDFNTANGATLVIAGSHKVEGFPSDDVIKRLERPIEVKAGTYLVLDSMTYHRGGTNTTGVPRRAVNNVYVLPFLKQQIVLPRLLAGKYRDDPALARLLGYDSDPPANFEEWWAGRDKRAGR